jgi:hypothetical protein
MRTGDTFITPPDQQKLFQNMAVTCLVFRFSLASLAIQAASFLAIVGAVSEYTSTISMPNELKICSRISTFNFVHPADHYTPLRTDPSPVDLEV